jgi:hypothetical protein
MQRRWCHFLAAACGIASHRWRERGSNSRSLSRIGAAPGLSRVTVSLRRLPRPACSIPIKASSPGAGGPKICGWTQGICGAVVAGGYPRGALLVQRHQKPALYCRGRPFAFYLAKCECAGLDNDRAQLNETAAAAVIEVDNPKRPARHCLLKKIHCRVGRDVMPAA